MRNERAKRRMRRTWPQRLALMLGSVTAVGCLGTGGTLFYANGRLGDVKRVAIRPSEGTPAAGSDQQPEEDPTTETTELKVEALVDPKARNFLLVGSDSRDCIARDAENAGAFLNGDESGNNSDTIMVIRVDPVTSTAAILSFPRDLWVKLPTSNGSGRINSVYTKKDPTRLVATIEKNFGFRIDHYLDVDFCAFVNAVEAVDGVSVPFMFPAYDSYTGLNVPKPGCSKFNGEEALAYVRSRHYQWYDGRKWRDDGLSDISRIARQQDFIKRILQKAIDRGARRPNVAKKLLDIGLDNVTIDDELTLNDLLVLAQSLKGLDPNLIKSYRFEGTNGAQFRILPSFNNPTNKNLLAVFRGEARLADAPDTSTDGSTTTVAGTSTTTAASTTSSSTSSTIPGAPTTTIVVEVAENRDEDSIVPPNDPTCR